MVLQSKKYENDGAFIKYWVPELKALDAKHLHYPADFESSELGGLIIGKDYPRPVIDSYSELIGSK